MTITKINCLNQTNWMIWIFHQEKWFSKHLRAKSYCKTRALCQFVIPTLTKFLKKHSIQENSNNMITEKIKISRIKQLKILSKIISQSLQAEIKIKSNTKWSPLNLWRIRPTQFKCKLFLLCTCSKIQIIKSCVEYQF